MEKERTGVGEYAFGLLDAVFKIDKENQYFLFYNSYQDVSQNIPRWDYHNVRYVSTRWPNKIFNVFLLLGLIKLDKLIEKRLKDYKIKKLDCFFSPNFNFTCLSKRVKFMLTVHDLSFEFLPECYTFKQRLWHKLLRPGKQCRRADVVLTPSESTKRDVASTYGIGWDKIKVCYPGLLVDYGLRLPAGEAGTMDYSQKVKEKYDLPEKFILFLGTIEPRKNVEAVIEAYKQTYILTNLHTYKLIIAGARGWKNKEIFEMIEKTSGVRYINYVAEEDKPALYRLASLFVYPSLYEGFGLPVLEAMACGTPVITSHRASLPEVGGNAVYYVNPANVAELSEAMELALKNEDLRSGVIVRQKEKAKKFAWNRSAEEFMGQLRSL